MTLFHAVVAGEPLFEQALCKYFAGTGDALSLRLLAELG
jgi:hypothetical protein